MNVVTLLLVSCRITVRAPSEALGVAASVNATPGMGGLSVDWIVTGLLTVRSLGPLILIVIEAERPVPNIRTVIVEPCAMLPPVFEAEPLLDRCDCSQGDRVGIRSRRSYYGDIDS